MASEDYSVGTKVTADVSNFERGMNKAEKSLKGFSDKLADNINRLGKKGLVGSLGSVGLALGGITSAVGIATKAIKKVSRAIGECTEAFREQNKAEIALETAAKNNPYVDGTGVKALKQFASEIQSVSNYGDEELLPLISNLTALGRTESETMEIIRVAIDMASTGMVSLDTAVNQLNMTLNGNIGRLGVQNAELKYLSEEELKNGKAVEILGKKYKGLSEATVDTSKQLKNAVGDFKELIGESFEKALAPMREYFAELITHVNDAIKSARQQKEAFDDVFKDGNFNADAETENLSVAFDKVMAEYREVYQNQQQYLKLYGAYIDQETDETAKAYKERISDLSRQIKQLSEELIKRRKESDEESKAREERDKQAKVEREINDLKDKYLKKIAEQEAKWANIKKVTGEAVKNEERLKFYQEQLVAIMTESGGKITENNQYYKDQMAIIQGILAEIGNPEKQTEWADKLLDQRIEMLEAEKNSAVEGAEERGEATYEVERYYNEKILDLKLQQIEREREEALKGENVTAKAKIAINQYYDNEVKKIYDDLGKYKAKKNKEEVKETKTALQETLKNVASIMQEVSKKMTDTFSKVVSKIKSIFSGVGGFLSKLFEFKPDEVLDNILKFEDSVLTFFVETLPKTPNFFASVFESIGVLIKNVRKAVKAEDIRQIIRGISNIIVDNLPQMIDDLVIIIEELVDGVIEWLDSDEGLEKLLELILKIQKAVEKFVTKNLDKLVDMLSKHIDDFSNFLAESMTSANNTLPKLTDAVLKLIGVIIKAVAGAFKNQEFIDSIVYAIVEMTNSIMDNLPEIIGAIVDLILAIINALAPRLPEIIIAFVDKLAETIPKIVDQLVDSLASGIGQIFKGLFERIFTWDFWVDALKTLGEVLTQIVADVFSGGLASLSGGAGNVTGNVAGDIGLGLATGGVSYLGHLFGWWAKGTNNAPAGLSVVGEAGPELVRFRGGEQVINNRNTQKLLSDAGGKTINQSITFNNIKDTSAYAMMNQLKQYNRQMAINGVI